MINKIDFKATEIHVCCRKNHQDGANAIRGEASWFCKFRWKWT